MTFLGADEQQSALAIATVATKGSPARWGRKEGDEPDSVVREEVTRDSEGAIEPHCFVLAGAKHG